MKKEVIDEDIHQIIEVSKLQPNLSEIRTKSKAQLYSCNIEITPINIMNLKIAVLSGDVNSLFIH
jgi:hypothetical protein